jgi:hypothetical protein
VSVLLEAIKFNHDSTSATNDALNIRRNATDFVTVPEWRRNISVNPSDSPAAYAISEARGHTITIKAKFRRTNPNLQFVEVRAIDPDRDSPPEGGGCAGWLLWLLRAITRALFGNINIMGEVQARTIIFLPNGETDFEVFNLTPAFGNPGVRADTITWNWQYRQDSADSWHTFETTRHLIYSVLEVPKSPWQQTPFLPMNDQLPWTEALDYACSWARLAGDHDTAAGRVTERVNNLGPTIIEYDCPGFGSHHYSFPLADPTIFNCTAFLERLRGGIGEGQYVNCTDCASIVSTFANLLGCDLWQSRMGTVWLNNSLIGSSFALNEILGIGSSVWQTACGWGSFTYHEVAWKDACTSDNEIFDACLKVDGDDDPTTDPHTPLLPVNFRFGNTGEGTYRDRLSTAATNGRPNCEPRPGWRRRKSIV